MTMVRVWRLATRGSKLALTQAQWVAERLSQAAGTVRIELEIVRTTGDRVLDTALSRVGGKGLFTKEIEEALLQGRADLAVHSLKDVPTERPPGLRLGTIGGAEDPRDAFLSATGHSFADLPQGAVVGTSSLRRQAQLAHARPDLRFRDIRGNVDTRLGKLDAGEYDAIVLACAGLARLGLSHRITHPLPLDLCLPAAGQGLLAVEIREDDPEAAELVALLSDPTCEARAEAERAALSALGGGCQTPTAIHARPEGDTLWIEGVVADLRGPRLLRTGVRGTVDRAGQAGETLAAKLFELGAGELIGSSGDYSGGP